MILPPLERSEESKWRVKSEKQNNTTIKWEWRSIHNYEKWTIHFRTDVNHDWLSSSLWSLQNENTCIISLIVHVRGIRPDFDTLQRTIHIVCAFVTVYYSCLALCIVQIVQMVFAHTDTRTHLSIYCESSKQFHVQISRSIIKIALWKIKKNRHNRNSKRIADEWRYPCPPLNGF